MTKILLLLLVASFNVCAMDENINTKNYGSMNTPKEELVDIAGLDKEEVLQALFTQAKPSGATDTLSKDQIRIATKKDWKVGSVQGKSLHVDLSKNRFDAGYYNEVNGKNAAQNAIASLKKQKSDSTPDKK